MKQVALIIAKGESQRLKNKNKLIFNGKPMFLWNVEKCKKIFDDVYVSSDDEEILRLAKKAGAHKIKRPIELCGNIPNIPVYQHALRFMNNPDIIVAVQANSPTVRESLIWSVSIYMQKFKEVMTKHKNGNVYGSIWGLSVDKLKNYINPYHPKPDFMLEDCSIDIHTYQDLKLAEKQIYVK